MILYHQAPWTWCISCLVYKTRHTWYHCRVSMCFLEDEFFCFVCLHTHVSVSSTESLRTHVTHAHIFGECHTKVTKYESVEDCCCYDFALGLGQRRNEFIALVGLDWKRVPFTPPFHDSHVKSKKLTPLLYQMIFPIWSWCQFLLFFCESTLWNHCHTWIPRNGKVLICVRFQVHTRLFRVTLNTSSFDRILASANRVHEECNVKVLIQRLNDDWMKYPLLSTLYSISF